jgi:hypothetical protein
VPADTSTSSQVETLLAQRLAHNNGWLVDDDSWERADPSLRKDYLELARETLAVVGGPTEAQHEVAALDAEVRALKQQRDRYRETWLSACRRRTRKRAAS